MHMATLQWMLVRKLWPLSELSYGGERRRMDKSEACLSVLTPTAGNLILSGREKGSGKYKKRYVRQR